MTARELVLFGGRTEYPVPQTQAPETSNTPGIVNAAYITVQPQAFDAIVAMFLRWFEAREEVELVDYGTSDKLERSFVVLEWFEYEIDQLFLDILDSEDAIEDYTEYSREVD